MVAAEEEDLDGLDLSHWEVAFNGAEPIRASTLKMFSEKFGPVGFNANAHYPCYGMAETTLLVTGGNKVDEPIIRSFDREQLDQYTAVPASGESSRELVGCGHVQPNEEIVIVDPNTCELLEEKQIGEIWITGTSVGKGYWEKAEETEKIFGATHLSTQ